MNNVMNSLLMTHHINIEHCFNEPISPVLNKYLKKGISVSSDQHVFFKGEPFEYFYDEPYLNEWSNNRIVIDLGKDIGSVIRQCISFAFKLQELLLLKYNDTFTVLITIDVTDEFHCIDESESVNYAYITFYRGTNNEFVDDENIYQGLLSIACGPITQSL